MEYKVLGLGRQKGKDRSRPVIEINPTTKESYPTNFSEGSFPDRAYQWFFHNNNVLVDAAITWGVELKQYEEFYILGFRVIQQLDGPLRERTERLYDRLYTDLQEELIKGVIETRRKQRAATLDALIENGADVPAKDLEIITGIVFGLKERPIEDERRLKRDLSLSYQQRCQGFESDRIKEENLVKTYALIPVELKADYLAAVTSIGFEWLDDVRKAISAVSIENGKIYLRALQAQREMPAAVNFFNAVEIDMKNVTQDEQNFYFRMLKRIHDGDVLPGGELPELAFCAVELSRSAGTEKAEQVMNETINRLRARRGIKSTYWYDVFSQVQRELVSS